MSLLLVFLALAQEIKVGDVIHVPGWREVQIKYGKKLVPCSIDYGGTVTVTSINGSYAELKYRPPAKTNRLSCPDTAIFSLSLAELDTFEQRYNKATEQKKNTEEDTQQILKGEPALRRVKDLVVGQKVRVPKGRWIESVVEVNLAPSQLPPQDRKERPKKPTKLMPGDACTLEYGAQLTILGFSRDKKNALIEYQPPKAPEGMSCPPGFIGYIPVLELQHYDKDFEAAELPKRERANSITDILAGRQTSPRYLEGVSVGMMCNVPKAQWITLERDVDSAKAGETCFMEEGGKFEIMGFLSGVTEALIKYTVPKKTVGKQCPSGVIATLAPKLLATFQCEPGTNAPVPIAEKGKSRKAN